MTGITAEWLRATVESWRIEADELVDNVLDNAMDTEWLAGRISALKQVLDLLDGTTSSTDLRTRLLGSGAGSLWRTGQHGGVRARAVVPEHFLIKHDRHPSDQ